jgi:hypothetical protein
MKVVGSKPERNLSEKVIYWKLILILDIGISDIDLVRYRNGS